MAQQSWPIRLLGVTLKPIGGTAEVKDWQLLWSSRESKALLENSATIFVSSYPAKFKGQFEELSCVFCVLRQGMLLCVHFLHWRMCYLEKRNYDGNLFYVSTVCDRQTGTGFLCISLSQAQRGRRCWGRQCSMCSKCKRVSQYVLCVLLFLLWIVLFHRNGPHGRCGQAAGWCSRLLIHQQTEIWGSGIVESHLDLKLTRLEQIMVC